PVGSISYKTPHGTATVHPDGSITYRPDGNYSGTDVFSYRTDADENVTTTDVTMTVTPISDAPTLTVDAANISTPEDTAVALGFNAPVINDATDQNGAITAGDNPERLGAITLTGIPNGA